jgi:hypothetical protein
MSYTSVAQHPRRSPGALSTARLYAVDVLGLRIRVAVVVTVLLGAGCSTETREAQGSGLCGSLDPGLRLELGCNGTLRVVLDGREIPPTPREVDAPGVVILPWPRWARDGMPSTAGFDGFAAVPFAAHPYECELVTVPCAQ